MKKLHLVMPMAGGGSRFREQGFTLPKPLIEIHDRPFFYWAARSILRNIDCVDVTFAVLEEHVREYQIDAIIRKFFPEARINTIPELLPGAVCTCLKAIENFDDDLPVIFNDCDHMFSCNILANRLVEDNSIDFDGALLTFESTDAHFSYVQYDESGNVIGTVEKQVVSSYAICGAYFFANAGLFRQMSEKYFKICRYREYFISGVYNELVKAGKRIAAFKTDFYLPFGTPAEYAEAKNSSYFELT